MSSWRSHPRRTSLAAWTQIQEEGLLARAQLAVYNALFRSTDGMTRNELDSELAPGKPNAPYSRRLSDLERAGVIERVGTRACAVSKRECEVWDVTDRLPVRPDKPSAPAPMPTPEQAVQACEDVELRIEAVRLAGAEPSEALLVLRNWLAAGAPRTRESRRVRVPRATPPPVEPSDATPTAPVPPAPPPPPRPAPRLERSGQARLF